MVASSRSPEGVATILSSLTGSAESAGGRRSAGPAPPPAVADGPHHRASRMATHDRRTARSIGRFTPRMMRHDTPVNNAGTGCCAATYRQELWICCALEGAASWRVYG